MSIIDFTDRLAWDLIYNNDPKEGHSVYIPPVDIQPTVNEIEVSCVEVTSQATSLSSVTGISTGGLSELMKHRLKKTDKRENGKSNRLCRVKCVACKVAKSAVLYCEHPMCLHSGRGNGPLFYCGNACFKSHIDEMKALHL